MKTWGWDSVEKLLKKFFTEKKFQLLIDLNEPAEYKYIYFSRYEFSFYLGFDTK